jgi:hypothetical protein
MLNPSVVKGRTGRFNKAESVCSFRPAPEKGLLLLGRGNSHLLVTFFKKTPDHEAKPRTTIFGDDYTHKVMY